MYLKDISKIIYVPETASENTIVTVVLYNDGRVAYKGKAKDLQNIKEGKNEQVITESSLLEWSVLSIAPDMSYKPEFDGYPLYNYPILITVY